MRCRDERISRRRLASVMGNFYHAALQVHALTQDPSFSFLFNVSSEQERMITVANSQHDAVVITPRRVRVSNWRRPKNVRADLTEMENITRANLFNLHARGFHCRDRKSTRLNSSHSP